MVHSCYSYFRTRYRYKTMEIIEDRISIEEAVEIFKLKRWVSKWAIYKEAKVSMKDQNTTR